MHFSRYCSELYTGTIILKSGAISVPLIIYTVIDALIFGIRVVQIDENSVVLDSLVFDRRHFHKVAVYGRHVLFGAAGHADLDVLEFLLAVAEPSPGPEAQDRGEGRGQLDRVLRRLPVASGHPLLRFLPDAVAAVVVLDQVQKSLGSHPHHLAALEFRECLDVIDRKDDRIQSLSVLPDLGRGRRVHRDDVDVDAVFDVFIHAPLVDEGGIEVHDLHDAVVVVFLPRRAAELVLLVRRYIAPDLVKSLVIRSGHEDVQIVVPRDESAVAQRAQARPAACPIAQAVFLTDHDEVFQNIEHLILQISNSKSIVFNHVVSPG